VSFVRYLIVNASWWDGLVQISYNLVEVLR
jgi:hypothetical protein